MVTHPTSLPPRTAMPGPRPLWTARHLAVVSALNALGTILIAVGWYRGSGKVLLHDEILWLNVGILGLIVVGAANGLHLFLGRRTVAVTRRTLVRQFPRPVPEPTAAHAATDRGEVRTGGVVAAAGMGHYHRPNCALAGGKDTRVSSVAAFEQAGLRRCEVCEP